jgi:hypothetical protein
VAITRSTAAERDRAGASIHFQPLPWRTAELAALLAASLLAAGAIVLTFLGRAARIETPPKPPLNLTRVEKREDLLPYLTGIPTPAARQFVARKIFERLRDAAELPNVGSLGRIRVPVTEVRSARGLAGLESRAKGLDPSASIPLLTGAELSGMKPFFVVRTLDQYRRTLIAWSIPFFALFYAVHIFWTLRRVRAPFFVLPAIHALCGLGFVLMITLRDPLRDTLAFSDFVEGAALGCVALAVASPMSG